jgi:glutathione synthase/RimK-type ligase-like ATP-grasp enzyme
VDWTFSYSNADASKGFLEVFGERYLFSSFSGAFVRLNPQPSLPPELNLPPQEAGAFVVERRYALQNLLNSLPFTVANRPCSGRSNASKPYQMSLLTKAGFTVPGWIVSNERAAVEDFLSLCKGGAIYKSCSGLRSKVRLFNGELAGRLHEGTSPVVVQEYIHGYDVRIHVVKDFIFATKVISRGVDYRFESEDNEFQATSAPREIEDMCRSFAFKDRLTIAGFDFRVTEHGQWYCLESNPVPTFLPYEMATGQAIGNTLLDAFIDAN